MECLSTKTSRGRKRKCLHAVATVVECCLNNGRKAEYLSKNSGMALGERYDADVL